MRFSKSAAAALAASVPIAFAQTFTDCNPTEKTCPKDTGLNHNTFTSDFQTDGASASWTAAAYSTIKYGGDGAEFSISGPKQAPTIETDFYIFFGRVDVKMKAAKGTGIVSSIVFESDDLDEIDWEFIGSDTTHVQSNFFGKGNTTAYNRVQYIDVDSPQDTFHTYSVDWNSDRINWIIDGSIVRTLTFDNALTVGGKNYPQTPMRIKLGNWCGGCKGMPDGTITWAGGNTTFDAAPYTMVVESVTIQNYNPADSYEYSDKTGDWQSIKIVNGGSTSSPSGTVTGASSISVTQTDAPTGSHSVSQIDQTEAAPTKTGTKPPYAVNTSANHHTGGGVATSVVIATTQVPGASPSGATGVGGLGTASGSPSGTAGGASASSTPGTGAGSINTAFVSSSLVGLLFSFLLL